MQIIQKPDTAIAVFDSVAEVCRYVIEECPNIVHPSEASHYGCHTSAEGAQYVRNGATSGECREAESLIDKVDAGIHGRTRQEFVPDVFGAYPMVPDYLAGMPQNMRHRVAVENDRAPIRVYIDVGVSGGASRKHMIRRGAACAALVMALNETRPVEAYAIATNLFQGAPKTTATVVRMDTNPVNLGQLVAVLASPQYARAVEYAAGSHVIGNTRGCSVIGWGWRIVPTDRTYTLKMRSVLDLNPEDIIIPGGYLSEGDLILADPVAWVEKYLAAQREVDA